ncbi:oligopeptide/dipeptide ABC transporter ATP-binding protein [Streptosporangium becharense]|uniref:Oligopeptide/dipeptide ABC transporter ATP-binding protein n=1 Tax=Streptosporangium becharense TaxID=1816182 RepID=A0A7W9IKF7_9ACTN|nr:ABC transporter ATP-binding protein [Streptosporangium becharense]MBB2911011.1 oligopeptide/dipeptide ABC transporter ATP-binding protein [Streptosporangium becharense]MBB5821931.1 oligopeptide/dipeptide ABC transporter ATP-binding protein [Streptosporangium becharense]
MPTNQQTTAERDVLGISRFSLAIGTGGKTVPLLADVTVRVGRGETVGLVGESGSGKSLTVRAALGMLPHGAHATGGVTVAGVDVLAAGRRELRDLRRTRASMIFQDPRVSVNPVRRVGDYLTEGLRARGVSSRVAAERALGLLDQVGIRDPRSAMRRFPHEFSGGMLQRVVIAGALSTEPELLLADEPTTALDVTTQAEVITLLKDMQRIHGTGMLFVTHDLDLAAAICDRIYVMYAGRIVEEATGTSLFGAPAHPYTRALLEARPSTHGDKVTIKAVGGRPRALAESPPGCSFHDRCPLAGDDCTVDVPAHRPHGTSLVACLRPGRVVS